MMVEKWLHMYVPRYGMCISIQCILNVRGGTDTKKMCGGSLRIQNKPLETTVA